MKRNWNHKHCHLTTPRFPAFLSSSFSLYLFFFTSFLPRRVSRRLENTSLHRKWSNDPHRYFSRHYFLSFSAQRTNNCVSYFKKRKKKLQGRKKVKKEKEEVDWNANKHTSCFFLLSSKNFWKTECHTFLVRTKFV